MPPMFSQHIKSGFTSCIFGKELWVNDGFGGDTTDGCEREREKVRDWDREFITLFNSMLMFACPT